MWREIGRHKLRQQWCPLIVFDRIQSSCLWLLLGNYHFRRLRLAGRTLLCITMARQTITHHWLPCWQQANKLPLIGHTCKSMEVRGEKTRALTKGNRPLADWPPHPSLGRPSSAGSGHPRTDKSSGFRRGMIMQVQSHEQFASNHLDLSEKESTAELSRSTRRLVEYGAGSAFNASTLSSTGLFRATFDPDGESGWFRSRLVAIISSSFSVRYRTHRHVSGTHKRSFRFATVQASEPVGQPSDHASSENLHFIGRARG